jgi:chromosome segregation ATPase
MSELEGSPWFWRIFGGAILSLLTILFVTLFNIIHTSNERANSDILATIQEIKVDLRAINSEIKEQEQKLLKIDSNALKESITSLEKKFNDIDTDTKNRNERLASLETALTNIKEQIAADKTDKNNTDYKNLYERVVALELELKQLKEKSGQVQSTAEAKKTMLLEKNTDKNKPLSNVPILKNLPLKQ